MKNRIYIDGRVLIPRNKSGVGSYVTNIIKSLDGILEAPQSDKDLDVKILIPFRAKAMVKKDLNLRAIGFRSIPLPFRGINILSRLNLLPALDIFYGKGIYIFPTFVQERLYKSKSIVFFYDFAFKRFPESLNQKQRTLLESRYQSSLKSDGVLTISNSVASEIARVRGTKKNLVVAQPAVDTRRFYRRSIDEIIVTKNHFRISGSYLLFVGNIEPRKNIESLVDAYRTLSPKFLHKYTLVIAGAESWSDSTINHIQLAIREGYKIKLLIGSVSAAELPGLYSGASAFIFPSVYEGFGMPILEAMACGVPVISGNTPEIIEAAGGASLVVPDVSDSKGLGIALNTLLDSTTAQQDLIQKGFSRISKVQEWNQSATTLYKLIENLKGQK